MEKCSSSLEGMLQEKLATLQVDIDTKLLSLFLLAPNKCFELVWDHKGEKHRVGQAGGDDVFTSFSRPDDIPTTSEMLDYQQNSRNAIEHVRKSRENIQILPVDFVEGGECTIPKTEYRRTSAELINTLAQKYYHYYKGLFFLEFESKIRLYLLRELQHAQGGDDELHKEVQKVADNMIKDPEYQEVMMKEFEVDKLEEERRAANTRNAAIQELLEKLKSSITERNFSQL